MTTTDKPTLESLGLTCSIQSKGIRKMNPEDANPMLAWVATFSNSRGVPQSFDYFTGSGCGPKPTERQLGDALASFRGFPKKSDVDCRAALEAARRAKWTPDPIEILWAIARDGDALESTFEDWAYDLGYDADSRRAEKVYRACQENGFRLRKILSADKIETLKALEL
jgi:hypothetical protein